MSTEKEVIVEEIVTKSYKWVCPKCNFTWILKRDAETKMPEEVLCQHCKNKFKVVK